MFILYIIVALIVLGIVLMYVEFRNAPMIDDKEPFLYGDYDPSKDPNITS